MKKIFLLAVAACIGCAAHAAHMTLQIPEAEMPSRVVAAQTADTMQFLPGVAYCRHLTKGDQQGLYYMVLSFLASEAEVFPQMQLHILVEDTMAISHEGNVLVAAVFYQSETAGGQAIGADVTLEFVQYDTVAGSVSAKYDIVSTIVFEKHEPICCKYRGYVTFISDDTNRPYVPEHEVEMTEAIPSVVTTAPVRKVMHQGRICIQRGEHLYDLQGGRVL